MKTSLRTILSAVLLCSSVLVSAADQPQKLHVTKGSAFNYSVKSETVNSTTMMGQENVSTLKVAMTSSVAVKEAAKDSCAFAIDFRDATLSVQGMSMFMIPDTTIHKSEMSAAKEVVTTNGSGKVLRRETATSTPSMDKEQILMRQLASRNLMRGMFVGFPDQVLKTGTEWTTTVNDTNDQGSGKVITSISMRYTYVGAVDTLGFKCGRVRAKSEKFVVNGNIKQMGHEVNIEGDGIVNSNYLFDTQTGMPVFIQSTAQSDQRFIVGEGMEIPSSIEVKTTIVRSAK